MFAPSAPFYLINYPRTYLVSPATENSMQNPWFYLLIKVNAPILPTLASSPLIPFLLWLLFPWQVINRHGQLVGHNQFLTAFLPITSFSYLKLLPTHQNHITYFLSNNIKGKNMTSPKRSYKHQSFRGQRKY